MFVQPKFDPVRSINRYLNGFQNNPGWVMETLASGMDIKVAGSIMGALLNFALIGGVEIVLISGWKDAFGWSGYKPGFNVAVFFTWALTLAVVVSLAVIVIGKATAAKGNRIGFEKFVTLIVAMLPLFIFGPILGAVVEVVLLVAVFVALTGYSFTTVLRGTNVARMIVVPLGTMLGVLWTVSLIAGWFSVSQSLPAGATGIAPSYNPAQATAQREATIVGINNAGATNVADWCREYGTPAAEKAKAEAARLGFEYKDTSPCNAATTPASSGSDQPVPGARSTTSTPESGAAKSPTPARTPTPKPTRKQ